jgi:hypothetical protein
LKTHERTAFEEFYDAGGIRFAEARGHLATAREAGKKAQTSIRFLRSRPLKIGPT